jgi:hypothetical protein
MNIIIEKSNLIINFQYLIDLGIGTPSGYY